jgi:hypothetical protein
MANQAFNVLGSIIILAMVSVALSNKSNTANVFTSFGKAFSGTITAAGNAGR